MSMQTTRFVPSEYWPTSPRSGNDGSKIFRMQNIILRGQVPELYAECYGGSLDLNENIPASNLTGTVSCATNSLTVTGVGTAFLSELHPGQFLLAYPAAPVSGNNVPMVVDQVISNTQFTINRLPHVNLAGATATRLPVMVATSKYRMTMLRGSVVETDLGTILGVGDGTVRRNGAVLPGTSMVLTRSPKVALLNSTTGNYTVFTLGLAAPASLAAAVGPAGTKNMQAGTYSIRAAEARLETRSYGNPSPKAEVNLTVGNKIQVTVPAIASGNAWVFFGTLFTQGGGINGPWRRIELPDIFIPVGLGVGEINPAGGTYDIEYNDAEIQVTDLLSFDNNPPPHAEFVAYMAGIPIWISCLGPGETSPGPFIASGRYRNIEAVPPAQYVSTSPPDTIVGAVVGVQGRLYLMCVNSLQIAMATQETDPRLPAFVVRPFWRSGFQNPETLLHIGDNIIGMTSNGLARSISEGDEGSEEYNFAVAVDEYVRTFSPAHCLIKSDPKNNAVVLFHSGHSINEDGWWTTRALMFGLRQNKWIGDILFSSPTGDRLVVSAATVNGQLEFLAGGRVAGGTVSISTYRWDDTRAAEPVSWHVGWQFTDGGSESRPKAVKSLRTVGKVTAGAVGIQGAFPGTAIDVGPISEGSFPIVSIPLATTTDVTQYDRTEIDVDNLAQWTVQAAGTWDGTGQRDRIDEIVAEWHLRGARR